MQQGASKVTPILYNIIDLSQCIMITLILHIIFTCMWMGVVTPSRIVSCNIISYVQKPVVVPMHLFFIIA